MGNKEEARQQILKRMLNVIKGQAMFVREDDLITDEDRLEQADILLNIMYYVQNYNEYTQVIAEHKRKKAKLIGREK